MKLFRYIIEVISTSVLITSIVMPYLRLSTFLCYMPLDLSEIIQQYGICFAACCVILFIIIPI